ncbi:helix-turn-helix domain-containing protein [uncultured Roseobacter sp.]|uniref:helix-turn-helix domain-containing protein n=1 Tax=uncultured Roseobacter sp. TaxID=114847 RepID=UPI00260CCF31|nr:helix-turn-helix domain-containing protein [uncultured Roseobacter sp.]
MEPKDPSNRLESCVGHSVKKHRNARDLTIVELSKISGVSSAMISKIERGQVSASLSTLDALAQSIGVPIANLFADTVERKEVSFVKAGAGIEVRRVGSTYGHSYTLVGRSEANGQHLECYVITIRDTAAGQPLFQHPGIEFIRMITGQMTYRVGGDSYLLEKGDCLTFDSEMPHGPVTLNTQSVEFFTIIVTP